MFFLYLVEKQSIPGCMFEHNIIIIITILKLRPNFLQEKNLNITVSAFHNTIP